MYIHDIVHLLEVTTGIQVTSCMGGPIPLQYVPILAIAIVKPQMGGILLTGMYMYIV